MSVSITLFIGTLHYRLAFYLIGCLLLNFMTKQDLVKDFIKRFQGRLQPDDLREPVGSESELGLKICRST